MDTEVTFAGATQEYVPADVYACCPITTNVGVTELLATLGWLGPNMFVATTLKVYAVPFVNPVTTKGEDAPVVVLMPQFAYTVYVEMTLPPVQDGAVKATLTEIGRAHV